MNRSDSRKEKRHKLTGTFVINEKGVGEVIDVSYGGLCFGCVNDRDLPETLTIDIVNSSGVHIWDLPVKKVWLKKRDALHYPSVHTVVVGAEFGHNLAPEQQAALDDLITSLQ